MYKNKTDTRLSRGANLSVCHVGSGASTANGRGKGSFTMLLASMEFLGVRFVSVYNE
jgi:hypothetical protein